MFFAQVNLGKVKEMASDRTMTKDRLGEFDTVKGHTAGSDVYIIYANKKAYPAYFVTYE
jgi:hypothetical protein